MTDSTGSEKEGEKEDEGEKTARVADDVDTTFRRVRITGVLDYTKEVRMFVWYCMGACSLRPISACLVVSTIVNAAVLRANVFVDLYASCI